MNIDLTNLKKVFFYGIGGIGISAVARMLLEQGKEVIGQDLNDSENIALLKNLGAEITIGQSLDVISADTDLIVYSRAIEVLEPGFLQQIKALVIPSLVYPEMLGLISKDKYTIAVSGSHGKTTTTGMVAHMLGKLGLDPTVVIGSFLQGTKSNFIQGKSEYFVVEADEYHRAFINLSPKILIITNIDLDHVDYYKDLEDIKSAYRTLAQKVPKDGFVVCDTSDKNVQDIVAGIDAQVIDYKENLYQRKLKIPGKHIQIDATFAYTVGKLLGEKQENIDTALETFPGTWRRFEFKGNTTTGAFVYDDYAHHPTEVVATLQAFRELYPKGEYKLHVFFQPHLFSRTKALFNEFTHAFTDADDVTILPIFKAREIDDGSMSSQILADAVSQSRKTAQALSFEEAKEKLESTLFSDKEVIITMGAGEAYKLGEQLLENS
jgi:UDP-N-acetylmuramate--alanine ligase